VGRGRVGKKIRGPDPAIMNSCGMQGLVQTETLTADNKRALDSRRDKVVLTDLDVNVSDEVVSKVVADVHLGNFSELAELLVDFLEEVFELLSGKKRREEEGGGYSFPINIWCRVLASIQVRCHRRCCCCCHHPLTSHTISQHSSSPQSEEVHCVFRLRTID